MELYEHYFKLSSDLSNLSSDLAKMIEEEKQRNSSERSDEEKHKANNRKGKSIQPLTKFYGSEKEAREASEMKPFEKLLRDRLKEIYKG